MSDASIQDQFEKLSMDPIALKLCFPRTCRICKNMFLESENSSKACRRHPESFSGETAQRWLAPGDAEHRNEVHSFFSCCGGLRDSPGCCYSPHVR